MLLRLASDHDGQNTTTRVRATYWNEFLGDAGHKLIPPCPCVRDRSLLRNLHRLDIRCLVHLACGCNTASRSVLQRCTQVHSDLYICLSVYMYRVGQKRGHRLMAIILSNLNRLKHFTGRFLGKFAVKRILKVTSHLAYVATLPCETLMSPKQAINYKLQGIVATYLRYGGVFNNQIKKGLFAEFATDFFLNR